MTSSSRLIPAAALNDQYVTWSVPDVNQASRTAAENVPPDPETLRQQAWDQGFAEGRAAGMAAGQQELNKTQAALECVLNTLARPLEELDVRVEEEILALVKTVTGHLVRRELKIDPSHIVGVIREGLAALPLSAEEPVIRLHPEDAVVVTECLGTGDDNRAWRIEADPVMQRGGCLIVTNDSQIDGRIETRLSRVLATMFEGERADDESD
ncbi:MAG: flagellar assembly protein FliH [Gammaproteobacteria bacterium]|nr:flagellar assembly protein FliH [Gammaproteobacteria bacterium]